MNDDKHITAEIIADSLNPQGIRITSWVLNYNLSIHAELLTHRVFSKNSASSRAIPTAKLIQQVIDNPALFVHWGKNIPGMQANEELNDNDKEIAKGIWLESRDLAVDQARKLLALNVHKQIVNRVLSPFIVNKIIMTGTEYENFFKLRAHSDAQPEFQNLAYKMKALYETNKPVQLKAGEWHVPFGDQINATKVYELFNDGSGVSNMSLDEWKTTLTNTKNKIAIARCARVSYLNYEGKDDYVADVNLCDRLFGSVPRHLSPTEHVAQALDSTEFIGNFKGFKQYRKFFADESGTA